MSAPRGLIEVDGKLMRWPDLISIRVIGTLYMAADTFEVKVRNDEFLSDWLRKNQEVKIYLGYVENPNKWYKNELTHVFTGKIDGVSPSFSRDMTCRIIGRDYSAHFLDTTFTVAYAERTASQIATILCNKYGLTPSITATTDVIDRDMYQNRKEWEILQSLADHEGFICYVDKNKTFYFGPRDLSDEDIEANLYYKQGFKSNTSIDFDDNSLDTFNQVTVRHYTKKQLIEGTARDEALISSMGQVKERTYYTSKVKSQAQAQALAEKMLPEFSRYVVTGKASRMAGIPALVCEKKVSVTGCGRFDGNYYVERFDHTLDKQGFITSIDVTSLRPDEAEQYRRDLYSSDSSILGSSRKLGSDTM
ncbi:phage late control D family protein [Paenibacillus alba]|uniref:YqbQ/XkdQ domain-containing protein n=1 Tax=Paenibacillus alba TaxID=1197127 RepID=A0ABU6GEV2_9BACL|nr:hypothetical protein [Paenibacillus alba]MEC0231283.1 hypothetical protein [Paenibacillus alba]